MNSLKQDARLGLGLMICLVGLPQVCETIYTPSLPAVAKGLNASVHAVEATLAIYFIGFAVGVLLWGTFSDYVGRRKTMLIGLVIFVLSCLACAFCHTVQMLLCWRFIQALGVSVGSVITQTMLRDRFDGKQRSQVFSILSGALAFSPAVGPLLGGGISEFFGWRANFWFLDMLGIVLLTLSFLRLPETKPDRVIPPSFGEIAKLVRRMLVSTYLWGHVLLIAATNGILFSFYGEAPFVFIAQLGMRPSLYGLLGIVIAGATIAAARISYSLSGKVDPPTLVQAGSLLTVIGGLGFTLIQTLGLLGLNFLGMSLILICLFGAFIGVGLIIPNSLSMALRDYQAMAGTAGSLFGAAYYSLIAIATGAMSLLHNGTAWPLPLYITFLGTVLVLASRMARSVKLCESSI